MKRGLFTATLCKPNQHTWIYASMGTVGECPPETRCDCGTYRRDQIHLINDVPTGEKVEMSEWQIGVPLDEEGE